MSDNPDIRSSQIKSLPKEITKEKEVAIIGDQYKDLPKLWKKKQAPDDYSDYSESSGHEDESYGDVKGNFKGTFKLVFL